MELRTTREMRRNEQLTKVMANKAEDGAPVKARSAPARPLSDKVSISQQAIEYLDQQRLQIEQKMQERRARQQSRLTEAQSKSSELDMLSKQMKVLELCQKIASSIIKGDKVPPQDMIYLMKNDPEGYRMALALRRPKKDPEEVDSVLEDEENQNRDSSGEDGGETAGVSAAEGSGGGEAASSGGEEASASAE